MKIICSKWLPIILWCFIIFYFTESPLATGDNTARIIAQNTHMSYSGVEIFNTLVRKNAHFIVFGILALLFYRAINPSRHKYMLAWVFTTLYALSDEWHQAFVPARSASLRDVLLDSAGALIFLAIHYIRKQTAKNSNF